ncbi:uncharacterized protein LOC121371508 [Gigantopelta aegis]|uniref:uncharacterized protein LOC121371508 n=1 Tax=Gigantopelta aegis TaxID=1735272 RepID=UPI001B88C3EB|nr:uncharacterized protein LOC121371508 [Gigantopelta aegis]
MYLAKLREAAQEPGENDAAPTVPAWLDMEKFNRGRQFFVDNIFSCITAMLMSLVLGLSIDRFLDPLVFTGKSGEPRKSLRRYISTVRHVIKWHYGDVWDFSDSDAHKSIMSVRKIHQKVAQDMTKSARCKVKSTENDASNGTDEDVFLSQYDMALVQSGFMGMITMYPESFGIQKNITRLDDYIYFWSGIGHLLGISDKNNICNDGYGKAYAVCKEIENDIVIPALVNPPKDFSIMMNALIDGLHLFTKYRLFTFEVILLWISDVYVLEKKLEFYDYTRYYFLRFVFICIRYCGPFRRMANRVILRALGVTQ